MTKEKQARLEEIEKGTHPETIQVFLYREQYDFLITELKSAWQREAELVKALDSAVRWLVHNDEPAIHAVYINSKDAIDQHKSSLEK